MKSLTRFAVAVLLMASPWVHSAELAGLGTVTFPTSASGPAQDHFLRGVTIMHSSPSEQNLRHLHKAKETWRAVDQKLVANLPPGRAYVSASAGVLHEEVAHFLDKPRRIDVRPRVSHHSGGNR